MANAELLTGKMGWGALRVFPFGRWQMLPFRHAPMLQYPQFDDHACSYHCAQARIRGEV